MEKLIITPKTKIYDLLETYPELEDVLIKAAPEFSKLKNPVLRNTIARITNISQAAVIGSMKVEDLVNKLRATVGQDTLTSLDEAGSKYNTGQPAWFNQQSVINTIDVREMLNRGEHPVHEVLAAANNLKSKEILEIIAPFIPAPMIDKTISLGYNHWIRSISETEFRVYFQKTHPSNPLSTL